MRFLLSIGCNVNREEQMSRVQEVLTKTFPGITFSKIITSPDDTNEGAPYSNCIARGNTDLSEAELCYTLKDIERQLGRTDSKPVMMDIDILQYGDAKRHLADWERPYIKALLGFLLSLLVIIVAAAPASKASPQELLTDFKRAKRQLDKYQLHQLSLVNDALCRFFETDQANTMDRTLVCENLKAYHDYLAKNHREAYAHFVSLIDGRGHKQMLLFINKELPSTYKQIVDFIQSL